MPDEIIQSEAGLVENASDRAGLEKLVPGGRHGAPSAARAPVQPSRTLRGRTRRRVGCQH